MPVCNTSAIRNFRRFKLVLTVKDLFTLIPPAESTTAIILQSTHVRWTAAGTQLVIIGVFNAESTVVVLIERYSGGAI